MNDFGVQLQDVTEKAAETAGLPGACVVVAHCDRTWTASTGIANARADVPVTDDTIFQIGSITKVFTATLVLALADQNRIDLDAPVSRYLPDFAVGDDPRAKAITVRHLLSHTGGLEGDVFEEHGRGADAASKFVANLRSHRMLTDPGAVFSYANSGYVVLGEVARVAAEAVSYEDALRRHVLTPLGARATATLPEEALLYRAALGHVGVDPSGRPVPAPIWALMASSAAAGSQLSMTGADLVRFARMHLREGVADDGTTVLTTAAAAAMRTPATPVPFSGGRMGEQWGLGWEVFDWSGRTVIGHDGATLGQAAMLRVLPDADLVLAVLTNGGSPLGALDVIAPLVFGELAGLTPPPRPLPPREPVPLDTARVCGTYLNAMERVDVESAGEAGRFRLVRRVQGPMAELVGDAQRVVEVVGFADDVLIDAQADERGIHGVHVLAEGPGPAAYLHSDGRLRPRVG